MDTTSYPKRWHEPYVPKHPHTCPPTYTTDDTAAFRVGGIYIFIIYTKKTDHV